MTNSRRAIAIALTVVPICLAAAPAFGNAKPQPSTIKILGSNFQEPDQESPYGVVTSSARKCVANRTVKIYFAQAQGAFHQVDTARTSDNGAWAGSAPVDSTTRVKAVVEKSVVGRKHHRKTCMSDTSPVYGLA